MEKRRLIKAGRLLDGTGAPVLRNVVLAVEKNRIAAIIPDGALSAGDLATMDDFSHCTLLPPLVDCSLALARSPSITALEAGDEQQIPAMVRRHLHYCHGHGVLGLADSGGVGGLEETFARAREEQVVLELRSACKEPGTGGDFLRIRYSPDIDGPDEEVLRPGLGELQQLLHARGEKKGIVVANGERQVREALEAGCDAIEQGYAMGRENLAFMAEKKILWIPSLVRAKNSLDSSGSGGSVCCRFSLRYVAPGKAVPGGEALWKKILADQLAQLRLARELGVATAFGTGAGAPGILHGESMAEEMKLFLKAGYPMEEAIRSATINGARFFGMDQPGALLPGRRANFLIVRGTLQQLPRKLSYLEGLYIDGAPSGTYRKF